MMRLPAILRIFGKQRVGVALGSGGSKGIAHISVLEFIDSLGIPVHMISGSSIGAFVGAIYSVGALKRLREDLLKMNRLEMLPYFDPVFPISGMLGGKKVMEFMRRYIPADTRIEDLKIPLGVVATDLGTGRAVVFRSGNLLEALRASISIPGIFEPVRYRDGVLVDGGVANPLPIDVVKGMGAGVTIAVNLNPSLPGAKMKHAVKAATSTADPDRLEIIHGHVSEAHSVISGKERGAKWLRAVEKWLGTGAEKPEGKSLPNIFEVVNRSIDIMGYVNTMLILAYVRPTVLIEPDLVDMPTLDFTRAEFALRTGREAAERAEKALLRKVKRRI
jgi:NTE family protein